MEASVKRNTDQLTAEEAGALRFQIGMSKGKGRGGRRYLPYVFTEQGVAMLSSVLRSKRAVQVNVEIMRAFVRLRRILASNEDLARKLAPLEITWLEIRGPCPPQFPDIRCDDRVVTLIDEVSEIQADDPLLG